MRIEAMIIGVSKDTWFRGSRDEREVTVLNCVEHKSVMGKKLRETFEYTLGKEELALADWGALEFTPVVLVVEHIRVGTAGRIRFAGVIDQSSLPKKAASGK